MPKKLGLYICSGCFIGEAMATEKLSKTAAREIKPAVLRSSPVLCGKEAVAAIEADIAGGQVDGLVIAACSPRVKTDAFAFSGIVMERVNLREHVAWCHKPKDEDTQMLAEDYLRMGAVKAQKSEAPVPLSEGIENKVLVVGGGIAGITAALEAAIIDILDHPEKAAALGKAGYERVHSMFTWKTAALKVTEVYREAMRAHRPV